MNEYSDDALAGLHICTKLEVPPEKFIDAAEAAINENPNNAAMNVPRGPSGGGGPLELAMFTEKKWLPGRTLRVGFLDGVQAVKDRLIPFAKQWEEHANLSLDFVDGEDNTADIRISFLQRGSWSYLGTDALVIDPADPTMNYGWLTADSHDDEYSRVVLHEFGHALAAIHEQQSPVADIPWDRDAVYRYYALQGWDRDQTDRNVLRRRDPKLFNYTEYDPTSIMQYAVPQALTIGDFEIGWNRVLSERDKAFMAVSYPETEPVPEMLTFGGTVDAEIGTPGEEDQYQFTVDDEAVVKLETGGPTDVVMSLFGPDDRTFLLATDDDSGMSLNARISERLMPGEYFVRVRHYSKQRGGTYTLTLR